MNIHKNARTTPYSRLLMARRVGAGERAVKVAGDFCVSEQTVRKMGAALAERRRDRAAGSQLEARAPARHARGAHLRDRTVAPTADELAGDRAATRHAERDGDKDLAPAWPQSPQSDRPTRPGRALPAGAVR